MAIIYETTGKLEIHLTSIEAKKAASLASTVTLFELLRRMYEENPDGMLYTLTLGCGLKLDATSGLESVGIPCDVRRDMQ